MEKLCQVLIDANIPDNAGDCDWYVNPDNPTIVFSGGIANSEKAFFYLKDKGLINDSTCPFCLAKSSKHKYSYDNAFNHKITFRICKKCYSDYMNLTGIFDPYSIIGIK